MTESDADGFAFGLATEGQLEMQQFSTVWQRTGCSAPLDVLEAGWHQLRRMHKTATAAIASSVSTAPITRPTIPPYGMVESAARAEALEEAAEAAEAEDVEEAAEALSLIHI